MLPTLKQQISNFFLNVNPRSALVFTTFGLDEAAMVRLLKMHKVPTRQRIVVYHEIMKHRNPGILEHHYPNSKVVAVELSQKLRKGICPIFHSKLWMEVSKAPFRCIRMAVLSGNITRYHFDLDMESRTCESFVLWQGTEIKLPKDHLFEKSSIFEGTGMGRLRTRPATYIIDDRIPTLMIQKKEAPVFEVVSSFMKYNAEELIACAAPFINKTPIDLLNSTRNRVKIMSGKKRDGTQLHAKIIEMKQHVILGSPNITKQAYGLTDQGIINHETIVLSKKPKDFSLSRLLKGFTRVDLRDLDNLDREPFEDTDGFFDWLQQKEWSVRGPESTLLLLNEHTGRVEIRMKGKLDDIRRVTIHNYVGDRVSDPLIECPPRRHLKLKKKEQQQRLVEAVLSPPVLLKGIRGKNTIWVREVNLGEFWGWIESNAIFMRSFMTRMLNGSTIGLKDSTVGSVSFDDVRQLRLRAYTEKKLTSRVQLWHKWLSRYSKYRTVGHGIPHWCIELGKRLRRL